MKNKKNLYIVARALLVGTGFGLFYFYKDPFWGFTIGILSFFLFLGLSFFLSYVQAPRKKGKKNYVLFSWIFSIVLTLCIFLIGPFAIHHLYLNNFIIKDDLPLIYLIYFSILGTSNIYLLSALYLKSKNKILTSKNSKYFVFLVVPFVGVAVLLYFYGLSFRALIFSIVLCYLSFRIYLRINKRTHGAGS